MNDINSKTLHSRNTAINDIGPTPAVYDQENGVSINNGRGLVHVNSSIDSSDPCCNGVVIYKRRWYILFLFSCLCFNQNIVWNTWGPLTTPAAIGFNLPTSMIALLTNWGMITYVITVVFFCWLLDTKGLRVSCLTAGFLTAAATALRCISCYPATNNWLIHTGQFLNGLAGTIVMSGPPLLSAVWFPAYQRTISTSISLLAMNFGVAASFLISPIIVPNITLSDNSSESDYFHFSFEERTCGKLNCSGPSEDQIVILTRRNIMRLMYLECAWSVIVLIAVIIWFPDQPPSPPSITAGIERVDFKNGLKRLFRHIPFWRIGLCYAISLGVCDVWGSLLNFYLPHSIDADWLGFYGSLSSAVAGCIVSRFADVYSRHIRSILLILYCTSFVACLIFALQCQSVIPLYTALVYVTFIVTSAGIEGCSPILFELVCETSYPIAEGVTTGLSTWLNNVVGLIFTLAIMIPSPMVVYITFIYTSMFIGGCSPLFFELVCETSYPIAEGITNGLATWMNNAVGLAFTLVIMTMRNQLWMNWMMLGSIAVCIPVFCLYKESYNRLDIDDTIDSPAPPPPYDEVVSESSALLGGTSDSTRRQPSSYNSAGPTSVHF